MPTLDSQNRRSHVGALRSRLDTPGRGLDAVLPVGLFMPRVQGGSHRRGVLGVDMLSAMTFPVWLTSRESASGAPRPLQSSDNAGDPDRIVWTPARRAISYRSPKRLPNICLPCLYGPFAMAGERTAVCAPARCVDRPTRGSDCGERLVLEASIVMAREPEVAGDHCRRYCCAAAPDSKAFTRDSWDCWWDFCFPGRCLR